MDDHSWHGQSLYHLGAFLEGALSTVGTTNMLMTQGVLKNPLIPAGLIRLTAVSNLSSSLIENILPRVALALNLLLVIFGENLSLASTVLALVFGNLSYY